MTSLLLPLINQNLVEQRRKEIGHIIFVTFLKLCDPAPALIIFLGQEIIYAWARNAPKLELPPAVGFKVGGPRSDVKFLVLQVQMSFLSSFVLNRELHGFACREYLMKLINDFLFRCIMQVLTKSLQMGTGLGLF